MHAANCMMHVTLVCLVSLQWHNIVFTAENTTCSLDEELARG